MNDFDQYVALLAPVPLVLIEEGRKICDSRHEYVAYGSRDFQLFRELEHRRAGKDVRVYLYESHTANPKFFVRWRGRYIGSEESQDGRYSKGRLHRPKTTVEDGEDRAGYWACFWEVAGLESIEPIPITSFRGIETKRDFDRTFVPRGPILIQCP